MTKTVVIGLDGVPYWLIERMMSQNELNYMKILAREGVYGVLEAIPPIFTPSNWTSAFTGVDPREHGIFTFSYINKDYRMLSINSRFRRVDPVWLIASRRNKKSIVVNVPVTYPPDQFNGIMISGDERIGRPSRKHVYPDEIYSLIEDVDYEFETPLYEDPETVLYKSIDSMKKLTELFLRLLVTYEWDLGIVVYRTPDIVFHKFLGLDEKPYVDNVEKFLIDIPYMIMRYLDITIARIVKTLDENTNIIIISDHGHKPKKVSYYINNILIKGNFIHISEKTRKSRHFYDIRSLRRITLFRYVWYLLPENIKPEIKNLLSKFFKFEKNIVNILEGVGWDKTLCLFNNPYGTLYINAKGRFKNGIVDETEYNAVIRKIVKYLQEINEIFLTRLGVPLYKDIIITGDVDSPLPYPDLIVEPHPDALYIISLASGREVVKRVSETYSISKKRIPQTNLSDHIKEGFYIFHGPIFNALGNHRKLIMMDIAPLILYSLKVEIPNYMQGKLPVEVIKPEYLKSNPPRIYMSKKQRIRRKMHMLRKKIKGK